MNKIADREEFTKLVLSGWTIPQLMTKYVCSRGTIATAKKNWGLVGKTPNAQKINSAEGTKHCFICDKTKSLNEFYSNGKTPLGTQKFKPSCSSCENKQRRNTLINYMQEVLKELNIEYKCLDCSITGPYGLLDFHHRDPSTKLFNIGQESVSTYSYSVFRSKIVEEILKCDILCPTCHRRRHILRG